MKKVLGTIGATLAVGAVMATAGPAGSADPGVRADAPVPDRKNFSAPALNPEPAGTAAEVDVSGDKAVLVNTEPPGGSPAPTSNPVLSASMT
jgi:pyruvate/2-oxoglutarate dehydrogenase complex dihydrolipoamide acyltransferase (E2) component